MPFPQTPPSPLTDLPGAVSEETLLTEEEDIARCRAVEEALFRRACGYKVTVKKTYKVKRIEYDETTGKKLSEREELECGIEEEHVPADVRVCAYYLNNRDPARWREHPADASDGEPDGVVEYPPMEKTTDAAADSPAPEGDPTP